jgi:hypothetical protein
VKDFSSMSGLADPYSWLRFIGFKHNLEAVIGSLEKAVCNSIERDGIRGLDGRGESRRMIMSVLTKDRLNRKPSGKNSPLRLPEFTRKG